MLAAGFPGTVVRERLIPAPFATVWDQISDLERAVPASEWHVRSLRITEQRGDRLSADVQSVIGLHDQFAIVLRPGWCWMEGRLLVAGMAAVADPAGTRLAWAAGVRMPAAGLARPLLCRSLDRSLRRVATTMTPRTLVRGVTIGRAGW